MSDLFIGRGWAFPLRTNAAGGIAMVAEEQEIEESIRLVLGTAPGERPMRPSSGAASTPRVRSADAPLRHVAYDVLSALGRVDTVESSTSTSASPDRPSL